MFSNLVSKVVQTGQSLTYQIDGCLTLYTAGQTVLLNPWDAVVFTAAGIVA